MSLSIKYLLCSALSITLLMPVAEPPAQAAAAAPRTYGRKKRSKKLASRPLRRTRQAPAAAATAPAPTADDDFGDFAPSKPAAPRPAAPTPPAAPAPLVATPRRTVTRPLPAAPPPAPPAVRATTEYLPPELDLQRELRPRRRAPRQADKPPVWKRWWFWTAIGGAVVTATAVGVGVGLANRGPSVPSDIQVFNAFLVRLP